MYVAQPPEKGDVEVDALELRPLVDRLLAVLFGVGNDCDFEPPGVFARDANRLPGITLDRKSASASVLSFSFARTESAGSASTSVDRATVMNILMGTSPDHLLMILP